MKNSKCKKWFFQISDRQEETDEKNWNLKKCKNFFCEFRAVKVFGLKLEIRRKLRFAGFSTFFGVRKRIRIGYRLFWKKWKIEKRKILFLRISIKRRVDLKKNEIWNLQKLKFAVCSENLESCRKILKNENCRKKSSLLISIWKFQHKVVRKNVMISKYPPLV